MTRADARTVGASRPLHHSTSLACVVHAERAARWLAEADIPRLLDRPPRRPIRQAVGRSMVRIGARLATEHPLDMARSR